MKGIIMQSESVKAIGLGTKSQTRRLHKRPMYKVGEIVYVKENWWRGCWTEEQFYNDMDGVSRSTVHWIRASADNVEVAYMADGDAPADRCERWDRVSSMLMPKWASRYDLTITDVREQALQDISPSDACDEGALSVLDIGHPLRAECYEKHGTWTGDDRQDVNGPFAGAVSAFATMWDSINKDRAPWASNPTVFAYTFEVTRRPA